MTPYAEAADRVRALYRIPTAPSRNRTLEVCHGRQALLPGQRWPGVGHAWAQVAPGGRLEYPTQHFDLIILHRTLDDLAAASAGDFDAGAWLQQVATLLVPGGLLAGCIHRRDGLRALTRRVLRRGAAAAEPAVFWSVAELRRMLAAAGLVRARSFILLPGADAPLKLVEDDPQVARFAFGREVEVQRRHLSATGLQVRQLAVRLGLAQRLEAAVFFWAYRPC